jgi:hypothetical protein
MRRLMQRQRLRHSHRLLAIAALFAISISALQILLGAPFHAAALTLIIALFPCALFLVSPRDQLPYFFVGILSVKYVLIAAVLKSLRGEPVSAGLLLPGKSLLACFVGVSAAALAVYVSRFVPVVYRVPEPTSSKEFRAVGLGCMSLSLIGSAGIVWQQQAAIADGYSWAAGGFTWLGYLVELNILAVVLLTRAALTGRATTIFSLDRTLCLAAVGLGAIQGMIWNSKLQIIQAPVALVATILLSSLRLRCRHWVALVGLAALAIFAFWIVFPAVHEARITRSTITSDALVAETISGISERIRNPSAPERGRLFDNYDPSMWHFNYMGDSSVLSERFALIGYLDPVIYNVDRVGHLPEFLADTLRLSLPRFINPDKIFYPVADFYYKELGMRDRFIDVYTFLAMPLMANGYVVAGFIGVFLITLLVFVYFFGVIRAVDAKLYGCSLGIFLMVQAQHVLSEGDLVYVLAFLTRSIWIFILSYVIILFAARFTL